MSFLSSGVLGRRRNEMGTDRKATQPTWDSYEHRAMETVQAQHKPPPLMGFPADRSPILKKTHIEWKETSEGHVYKVHLPGYKRNEVRVEVDDDRVLCIVCEKSIEKAQQRDGWHLMELSTGQFVQHLTLPHNSKVDHIKAFMDNTLLTITVPKLNKPIPTPLPNVNISSRP
ncbi:hypothetical protein VNO78_15728 [Psophocarpus tetragonolobus]|uniref:SHSP domain-containing protein n=1 Tax=Psophocarpus tetragonolobus TaxID=3891 RepID=A0AAN9SFW4_PSOTE